MRERSILNLWVEETIKTSDYTKRDNNKFIVSKKLNGRTIEVVYIKEKYIKVITVYWL